jgi:hypothetical protein
MGNRLNKGDLVVNLLKALEDINPEDEDSAASISSYLYVPDARISEYLIKLKNYTELKSPTPQQRREAGDLLEQIVVLTFCGLKGLTSIKSFRSAGPQYDLLVSGDTEKWFPLYRLLYMKENQRDIVVEAKCTAEKVSDQQFARLCSLMEVNLFNTTGLGIFFTLKGATGFPERGQETRQQQLSEARLRQALFHARTGKAIVVLELQDILDLNQPASLIQILIRKIKDIEHLSGLSIESCGNPIEVDLPKHLKPIVSILKTS